MAFVIGTTVITAPAGRAAGGLALGACAVLVAVFVAIDRRAEAPLLPRQLISQATLRQGALGGFLNTATTSSAITLVTLYLQNTLHRSPLQAAAALLPFSLAVIAGSSLAASVLRRLRPQQVVAVGLAVIAAADAALIPSAGRLWAIGLSSVPAAGTPPPAAAWAAGALAAAAGAIRFALPARNRPGRPRPSRDLTPLGADGSDGSEDGLDRSSGVGHHRHVRSSDLGDS